MMNVHAPFGAPYKRMTGPSSRSGGERVFSYPGTAE